VIHVFGRLLGDRLRVCVCPLVDCREEHHQRVCDLVRHPELDLSELSPHCAPGGDVKSWSPLARGAHCRCVAPTSSIRSHLALQLLQVCRQIWSEAVLTPFLENIFAAAAGWQGGGLFSFLPSLIPAQIRAISHLVLWADDRWDPRYMDVLKLEGLKSLHLVLPDNRHQVVGQQLSPTCLDFAEFGSLSQLNLKSVKVTHTYSSFFMSRYSFSSDRTPLTKPTIESIEELVRRCEKDMLGSPNAYLVRKKAKEENDDRKWQAQRATVRSVRRLRPLADTS
jgi:hypothetical protein